MLNLLSASSFFLSELMSEDQGSALDRTEYLFYNVANN